jgi:hypothetical protein
MSPLPNRALSTLAQFAALTTAAFACPHTCPDRSTSLSVCVLLKFQLPHSYASFASQILRTAILSLQRSTAQGSNGHTQFRKIPATEILTHTHTDTQARTNTYTYTHTHTHSHITTDRLPVGLSFSVIRSVIQSVIRSFVGQSVSQASGR